MPPTPRGRRRLAAGLALLPFAALGASVYLWGVDLPFWDQWQVVGLIERTLEGRLGLADLWRPHNDHRLFFPRLLTLALASATSWNVRWELAANVALAAAIFLVAARWLRTSLPAAGPALVPLASLLVFNLSQWENWTWGLQMAPLLGATATIAGLRVVDRVANARGGTDRHPPERVGMATRLLLAAALGAVATFSFANGLLFWPLALLLVLRPPGRRGSRALAWVLVTAAVAALFFSGYPARAAGSSSPSLAELPRAAAYVAVFLGAPVFPYDGKLAAAGGLAAGGAFLALIAALARDRTRRGRALPWIAVAGYGAGSAALCAAGRLELGLALAMSSRYILFGNFFWLGLAGLAWLWLEKHDPTPALARLAAAVVTLSLVAGSIWGGVLIHQQHRDRTRVREALLEGRFHRDLPLVAPGNRLPDDALEALRRHRLSLFREARPNHPEARAEDSAEPPAPNRSGWRREGPQSEPDAGRTSATTATRLQVPSRITKGKKPMR